MSDWARLKRTVAPSSLAVPLADIKQALRIDDSDNNAQLTRLIKAATDRIDGRNGIGFCLLTQTWTLTLDAFPADKIIIPLIPLIDITSITYLDTEGAQQTVSTSDYRVNTAIEPGFVETEFGASWPGTRSVSSAVTITFTAGHSTVADIPPDLVRAIEALVGLWYEMPEAAVMGSSLHPVPEAVQETLDRYRSAYIVS